MSMVSSQLRRRALLCVGLLALGLVLTAPVLAAANNTTVTKAPYYQDENTDTGIDAWLSGLVDATLGNVLELLTRIGGYLIGSGFEAQGGVGSAGILLTGALVAAMLSGVGIRARAGPVGGIVIATMGAFAFVSVGIGPQWLYPIVLFAVGVVATVALIRAFK